MHAYVVGHPMLAEVSLGLVFVLFKLLTSADTQELEQFLAFAVRDALNAAHIPIKVAALCMGITESQLAKQLRGEPSHHVSLTRLIRLPFGFWLFFGPALIQIIYRKRMEEMKTLSEVKRGA